MTRSPRPDIPFLARKIVELLADGKTRENILGDLRELSDLGSHKGNGRLPVWRELLLSMPGLVRMRSRKLASSPVTASVGATALAYGALILWSALITRPLMIELQAGGLFADRSNYLMFYLPVRLTGVAIVSGAVAFVAFRQDRRFATNLAALLIPLFLLIALPQVYFVVFAEESEFSSGVLWRIAGDALAIYLGASVGNWIRTRPSPR
ncbi:MAG: hypothetical protein AAGE86_04575 [Pseudomonadota bacterium]